MLQAELALAGVAGVGLAEDGVAVAGHHLARLELLPDELLQLVVGHFAAQFLLRLRQEDQHLQNKN